jgi:membrane dipeptidase
VTTPILDLLRDAPLIDGHNDLIWEMHEAREKGQPEADVSGPCPQFQTDLPRMRAGGIGGQFWSVYTPSGWAPERAAAGALERIDELRSLVSRYPDRLEHAWSADDVERIARRGKVASLIGVEGGHMIAGSLGILRVLAGLGMRYLTLTHNDDTPWADSGTGKREQGGLTAFGRDVIRELNRLGVLVDLSHTSEDTMRHAIEASAAPVIFSHSSARALCDVARNVPDDVLRLVARNGGVVMVTFVPWFLTPAGAAANAEGWAEVKRIRERHPDDQKARSDAFAAYFREHPAPRTTAKDVADHIDHIRRMAGIDHIGVGSDFDGSTSMPEDLGDVSRYPVLFAELATRGYSDDDLAKIAGRNVLRVMREAERVARGERAS